MIFRKKEEIKNKTLLGQKNLLNVYIKYLLTKKLFYEKSKYVKFV